MKKLAIYYGWPSLAYGLPEKKSKTLDDAIEVFSSFDIIVLGSGLESESHADHSNTQKIITNLNSLDKHVNGYIHLAKSDSFKCFSDDELEEKLKDWKIFGVNGVFFDLLDPAYGSSTQRIKRISETAHSLDLNVIYNNNFNSIPEGWFDERISCFAKPKDMVLIEPFATSWQKDEYTLPRILPSSFRQLQENKVLLMGVSTYDSGKISAVSEKCMKILSERFSKYRKKAEFLGVDAYQLTNGVYSSYGTEANMLIDFDNFV